MAVTRQKKSVILDELVDKFSRAKSVVFSACAGISVADISKLRKALRQHNIDYKVAKKTLVKIAAEKNGLSGLDKKVIPGQVAVAFGYDDEVMTAKTIFGFSKQFEALKIIGAVMDKKLISDKETIALAKIPSRPELLGKFVGMLRAPLYQFHGMLKSPLGSFARGIKAYADKKGA